MDENLEKKIGMLTNDELDDEILKTGHRGDPKESQFLEELLNEKAIRKNDPANSARAKTLQKMLDQIGRSNHDYTTPA